MGNHEIIKLSTNISNNHAKEIAISAIFIALAMLLNFYFLYESSTEERGSFGDMFGLSNALFSGLAICGLIYTLIIQRETMNLYGESIRISNLQANLSAESFRLQALTAAMNSIDSQIALHTTDAEKKQPILQLEETKKKIETEITKIINNIIKNQGA